ncbi:unnamed protein product [Vitrella brassicaformis CCMP3155]|uniref:Uncharacterized protein n=2 Tax=Vitrella brassicaformis TaxID=1169539 RepID=A0A0G4FNV6_VITBC|nr:unnamed protein product [Vitrella brassicaformis CCMP3155]|eukprot:CEM15909.1 unnamed protein product [Vitrella brassicaformis CCMP3155]
MAPFTAVVGTPGLVDCIVAFLPIHLLMRLSSHARQDGVPQHRHLTISAATPDERSFWKRLPLALIQQLAAWLARLTAITLRCPAQLAAAAVGRGAGWCFEVMVTIVEGHAEARRAAALQRGTLTSIRIFHDVQLTCEELDALDRTTPERPPPLVARPTLDALTSISGLKPVHQSLAERGWEMPSLAWVGQGGWQPHRLGRLVVSSRSLRRVRGSIDAGGTGRRDEPRWEKVFEGMPVATGQQPGPLSHLEAIGPVPVFLHPVLVFLQFGTIDKLR